MRYASVLFLLCLGAAGQTKPATIHICVRGLSNTQPPELIYVYTGDKLDGLFWVNDDTLDHDGCTYRIPAPAAQPAQTCVHTTMDGLPDCVLPKMSSQECLKTTPPDQVGGYCDWYGYSTLAEEDAFEKKRGWYRVKHHDGTGDTWAAQPAQNRRVCTNNGNVIPCAEFDKLQCDRYVGGLGHKGFTYVPCERPAQKPAKPVTPRDLDMYSTQPESNWITSDAEPMPAVVLQHKAAPILPCAPESGGSIRFEHEKFPLKVCQRNAANTGDECHLITRKAWIQGQRVETLEER